jgi:flagellar biosynthetic protein FliQ
MSQDVVVSLLTDAMALAFKIGLPAVAAALVVGVAVSVFQAVTQIQEMTLSFVPKIVAIVAAMVVAGPWALNQLVSYTQALYLSIPRLVGS